MNPVYLLSCAAVSPLGMSFDESLKNLMELRSGLKHGSGLLEEPECTIGEINLPEHPLPKNLEPFHSRCNRISWNCITQLKSQIEQLKSLYPPERIGVIIGTSASGTESVENAWKSGGDFGFDYHRLHSFGNVAEFLGLVTGFQGPAYVISTACSSTANALISAVNLIQSGICDAVLAGGAEALCKTTFQGFNSLQIVDEKPCRPLDADRAGLNLGEGAALFLLARDYFSGFSLNSKIQVLGTGWSSDGYHMTAPDPDGQGATAAMTQALQFSGLQARDIDYINLHGTGTPLNDRVEAAAVYRLFGDQVFCSSTKGFTGHLLGAAAAVEITICLIALSHQILPVNLNLVTRDPEIDIRIVQPGDIAGSIQYVMNNSFAFGGNNTSIILGVDHG